MVLKPFFSFVIIFIMIRIKKSDRGLNIDEEDEFENSAEAKSDAKMRDSTMKKSYFEEQEDIKKR